MNISPNTTNPITITDDDVAPAMRTTWDPDNHGNWTLYQDKSLLYTTVAKTKCYYNQTFKVIF